jgi:hypothetical protein
MSRLLRHYSTAIWLVLVLLTGLSWWLSKIDGFAGVYPVSTLGLLLVASFKVRLVGLHFMELRQAPPALRLLFEIWAAAVSALLLVLY